MERAAAGESPSAQAPERWCLVVVSDEEAKDADGGADIELAEREEHLTED